MFTILVFVNAEEQQKPADLNQRVIFKKPKKEIKEETDDNKESSDKAKDKPKHKKQPKKPTLSFNQDEEEEYW